MAEELLICDIDQMDKLEMEEACRELEDAYAEALSDNAGFDALNRIWRRIQELHKSIERDHLSD